MLGKDQPQRQGRGERGVLRAVGPAQQHPGSTGGLFHGGDGIGEAFLVGHGGRDDHAEVHQPGALGFLLRGLHSGAGIDQGAGGRAGSRR